MDLLRPHRELHYLQRAHQHRQSQRPTFVHVLRCDFGQRPSFPQIITTQPSNFSALSVVYSITASRTRRFRNLIDPERQIGWGTMVSLSTRQLWPQLAELRRPEYQPGARHHADLQRRRGWPSHRRDLLHILYKGPRPDINTTSRLTFPMVLLRTSSAASAPSTTRSLSS